MRSVLTRFHLLLVQGVPGAIQPAGRHQPPGASAEGQGAVRPQLVKRGVGQLGLSEILPPTSRQTVNMCAILLCAGFVPECSNICWPAKRRLKSRTALYMLCHR